MSKIKFTNEHEWLLLEEGNIVTVGITDYAQSHLGDLVYIQLPDVGTTYKTGDEVAVIESVKTAGGIAMPFNGKVVEINSKLNDEPGVVNEDPLGAGWFFKMSITDEKELNALMDESTYHAFVAKLG